MLSRSRDHLAQAAQEQGCSNADSDCKESVSAIPHRIDLCIATHLSPGPETRKLVCGAMGYAAIPLQLEIGYHRLDSAEVQGTPCRVQVDAGTPTTPCVLFHHKHFFAQDTFSHLQPADVESTRQP